MKHLTRWHAVQQVVRKYGALEGGEKGCVQREAEIYKRADSTVYSRWKATNRSLKPEPKSRESPIVPFFLSPKSSTRHFAFLLLLIRVRIIRYANSPIISPHYHFCNVNLQRNIEFISEYVVNRDHVKDWGILHVQKSEFFFKSLLSFNTNFSHTRATLRNPMS